MRALLRKFGGRISYPTRSVVNERIIRVRGLPRRLAVIAFSPLSLLASPAWAQEAASGDASDVKWLCFWVALVGVGLAAYPFIARSRRRKVAEWPEAEGEILRHAIEKFDASSSDSWGTDDKYRPVPTYRYTVGGTTYENSAIADASPVFDTEADAVAYLARNFPVGTKVPVHHDPNRPKKAVLQRETVDAKAGLGLWNWICVVIGVLLALFFGVGAVAMFVT